MLPYLLPLLVSVLSSGALPPPHHPFHRAPADLLSRIAKSNPATLRHDDPPAVPAKTGSRITPAQFGGDPTGVHDSSAAMDAALNHCLNQSKRSPNGFFPGQDTDPSFGPIRDMGGCNIVSQTLRAIRPHPPSVQGHTQMLIPSVSATSRCSIPPPHQVP